MLTDYFAESAGEEDGLFRELLRLKREQGLSEKEFYHFDTPLTLEHETEALRAAGFAAVEIMGQWGHTAALRAEAGG